MQKTLAAAAMAGASLLVMGQAHAQSAPAADAPAASGVSDIVVTAQKRESTAQKTAVAMTVFDAKALTRNNVATLQDMTKLAPSVSLGQNSAAVVVGIRGVSSRDTNEIADPAIAISIDGFSIQRPTGLSDAVFDLERVEVLRGPQGTLYGRSATGGAINFITAKPKDHFEASASVGYGNYNALTTQGMINVPVSDTLAVRASFATTRHDGYRTAEGLGQNGDDADSSAARLSVLWKPIDRLKIQLTGQISKMSGVGPTVEGFAFTTVDRSYRPNLQINGTPHSNPAQYISNTIKSVQADVEYDLGFATAMYIGGYRDMNYHQLRDLDGTTNASNYYQPNENPRDQQHEVRLVSNGTGRFKWQMGANYFNEDNKLLTYYQTYATSSTPTNRYIFDYSVNARSEGVFGQASYELIDGLTAEAGIRYSHDTKSRSGYQNLGAGNVPQDGYVASSKVTYHTALNWQATPRNLVYVKYDTGYKPGGFTTIFGTGVFDYAPETISAVEAGTKNRFLDNKLQLNVSAFHYNYSNQQVSVVNPSGSSAGAGTSYVINAGRSEIYGLEVEGVLALTPRDSLDLSTSYLHGRFKDLCTVHSTTGACTTNFAGNRAVQAPTWMINAGIQHDFSFLQGKLTPRMQTHYESYSYLGIENYGYQRNDGYFRSDAMLTYEAPGAKWNLQAYVRNLENAVVITTANASFGAYNYALAAPRTYGIKLTYNW
ncbi:TonB-dependent receptor [Novosphingobium sp.]|uniref:TonB-dependent receptor n=1 Tax=Novosphingobium sp. TaxID=1874826 RepID=UPI0031E40F95